MKQLILLRMLTLVSVLCSDFAGSGALVGGEDEGGEGEGGEGEGMGGSEGLVIAGGGFGLSASGGFPVSV